jgi:hypothetical protein
VDTDLAHEAGAWNVTVRLHEFLTKMVGPTGVDVLLTRALVLARQRHAVLVGFAVGSGGRLVNQDGAANDRGAIELAVVAVVANFLELLIVLIGEDLAMRLLSDVRQVASVGSASGKETKK